MQKFYVKITFPDITMPGCPDLQTVFSVYDDNHQKAAERAWHWGVAVMRDMMHHNKLSPHIIEQVAPELVRIVSVRLWRENQ